MMLLGYCINCRKVKRVRVRVPSPGKNIQTGVCRDCQEALDSRGRSR